MLANLQQKAGAPKKVADNEQGVFTKGEIVLYGS
jgi:hypothetical protein